MKKFTKKINLLLLLLATSYGFAQTARVQVIHNSPDAAAAEVDVYLNDEILLDNFKFRTAAPFIDAPAGVALKIDIAPASSSSSAESIYTVSPTLAEGETYVIVANGIVSPSGYNPAPAFALNVFAQGRETASNSSNTDILVNHGSPDAPTVDVVETSVPAGTVINDISYPSFTSGYLELPTADYVLNVTDETGAIVVASYAAPLQTLGLQGQALSVIASGFLDPTQNSDGPAFGLYAVLASGGNLIPLPLASLSTVDFNSSKISLYPNPTSSILNIDIPFNYNKTSGKVIDVNGRVLKKLDKLESKIDVSNLSKGMYILDMKIDDSSVIKKFFINK